MRFKKYSKLSVGTLYLTNAGILSNAQSGFRSNHSTSTTLHDVQDFILKNMDSGYATNRCYIS